MAAVAKEIVYEETASGIFAPAPTRSQKRAAKQAAKQAAELRRRNREEWLAMIGGAIGILLMAALGALTHMRW